MNSRAGHGPWARLLATAVVRDEASTIAERARVLVRDGAVGDVAVEQGTLAAGIAGCSASITAKPVPPGIWAAMTHAARGNPRLEEAVQGRTQSVHLEHLMTEDWNEPLVPRPHDLGRTCSCDADRQPCEHVAALAYAAANGIDANPSLLLRWRGCVAPPELPREAANATPQRAVDPTDDGPWRSGAFPETRPLRPIPAGAVLKRLGPSGLKLNGEDLATVLQRAYTSFAESADS